MFLHFCIIICDSTSVCLLKKHVFTIALQNKQKKLSQITICLCQVAVIFPSVLDRNVVIADACEKEICFMIVLKLHVANLPLKLNESSPFHLGPRGGFRSAQKNQQH